ncbi:hypothetical protein C8T65DRAFT_735798 [Cerioporus squamosus]|nr:hypothetical protein C8T65DRAFT_735798 [Cerioporus squamosus]
MSYSRDNVAQLRELGIPTKTAKYALEMKGGKVNAAADYVGFSFKFLLSRPSALQSRKAVLPSFVPELLLAVARSWY